jgi:hypothetical protein
MGEETALESNGKNEVKTSWLIDSMLPKGHRGMIATCEGGCKTTLLCWIAVCVATGSDLFGMNVNSGPVLMIDEETPTQSLEGKIYRFCLGLDLRNRSAIPHLKILSKRGFRFDRKNTRYIDLIKDMQPALITIDTLLACLPSGREGKGENNAETGIAVKDDLTRMLDVSPDSTILMAAHSRKPVVYYEIEDYREAEMQSLVRGHGSIVGEACDTGFGIKKLSQYPNPLRFAIIPKARREAIPIEEIFIEMEEEQYGKGKAKLMQIPPLTPLPSKAAIDLFSLFMGDNFAEIKASSIRNQASALYTLEEVRMALEQLRRRKVIITVGNHFIYKLNPKEREQADPKYVDQLLEGQHTT